MPRAATAAARSAPARKPRAGAPKRAPRGKAAAPKRVLRVVPREGVRPAALGSGLLDRLLRGRAWIAFIGLLLVGVVFVNVSLLEINRDITAKSDRIAALKRENGQRRIEVAELASSERIRQAAAELGFVQPSPGDVSYLKATPSHDARRAAQTIAPPAQQDPAPAEAVTPAPPQTGTDVAPQAAPQAEPQAAPQTGTEAVPQTGTEAAPQAAPEPAPQAAPEAAPEAPGAG